MLTGFNQKVSSRIIFSFLGLHGLSAAGRGAILSGALVVYTELGKSLSLLPRGAGKPTGWGNYFSHVVSKRTFSKINHILIVQLKRWAFRRHPKKSRKWVLDKYFKSDGRRKWCFIRVNAFNF